MLNRLIDGFILFIKDVRELLNIKASLKYHQESINTRDLKPVFTSKKGIPVYLYTPLLIINLIPSRIPGAIIGIMNDDKVSIFVNESFLKQDPSFIDAAIAHEEAHAILRHRFTDIDKDDIEADRYVLNQGYDIKKMLITLKHYGYDVNNRINSISKRSLP